MTIPSGVKKLALWIGPLRALYESREALKTALDWSEAQIQALQARLAELEAVAGALTVIRACEELASRRELEELALRRPELFDDRTEDLIREHSLRHGLHTKFQGAVGSGSVQVIGDELREHLLAEGLNSRQRAIAELLIEFLVSRGIAEPEARIYGHEGITRLASLLRGRFVRYLGSEFALTAEKKEWLWPIIHQDVCSLDFPDRSFDAIVSCDVLEHVPDLDAALSEAARVLRPNGRLLATFPFHWYRDESTVFATLKDGRLTYLLEPIYHGNPMDEAGGALVFQIPGWDIVPRAKEAGFTSARMTFICDQTRGIVASSRLEPKRPKGVFVTCFDR